MANGPNLKVGLVFDDSLDSTDGVAQAVKATGAWLTGRGHEVSYLVGETKMKKWAGGTVYSLSKNIKVRFNGNKLSIPLLAKKADVNRVLDSNDYDVLHVTVPYSPMMAARVIAKAKPKTAVVGTFHILPSGALSKAGSRLLGAWSRRGLKRMAELVSTSQPAATFAKQTYRRAGGVIPNPVDTDKFKTTPTWRPGGANIVFLGRLVKRKGAANLIEAFAGLAQAHPAANLTIAGDGPDRSKLESRVKALGLSGKIKFLGYIDEADKPKLLASANIACFPSLYGESFGIVLIEAMAAGSRVVLAGDNPGYRSVMSDQPSTLIDPTNTKAFTERLTKLLDDESLADQIHSWQEAAVKQYDINVVGAQVEALYERAIACQAKKSDNKPNERSKTNG